MKYKLLLIMLLGLFLIGNVLALDSLGTFKQGDNITIKQVCFDASYITIQISYPNSTIAISSTNMTSLGNGQFNYYFVDTNTLGRYDITGISDGCENSFATYFDTTPSGMDLNENQGWSIFGTLLIMIIISVVFLVVAFSSEGIGVKVTFFSLAGIFLIMTILYTVVVMQQTLFGFDSILSGVETFWFVVKALVGIGILALLIIVVMVLIKAWKIKRGYRDE